MLINTISWYRTACLNTVLTYTTTIATMPKYMLYIIICHLERFGQYYNNSNLRKVPLSALSKTTLICHSTLGPFWCPGSLRQDDTLKGILKYLEALLMPRLSKASWYIKRNTIIELMMTRQHVWTLSVCVCVCVWLIYIYIYILGNGSS